VIIGHTCTDDIVFDPVHESLASIIEGELPHGLICIVEFRARMLYFLTLPVCLNVIGQLR
jgi:hypothetical protein